MQIVLLRKVGKLGSIGDVVGVKSGYARNFLLPKKMALRATERNLKYFAAKRSEIEEGNARLRNDATAVAGSMSGIVITLIRQASESGFLFGSVRSSDIVSELSRAGYTISKAQVKMSGPIKTVGTYNIGISLHPEVTADVLLRVMTAQEQVMEPVESVVNGAEGEA
jgi:large subunit ribosomal protein L9